jgi:hypothetical protein
MNVLDDFYARQEEPVKGCLLALKHLILSQDEHVTNELKYGMPFFCYRGKMFCYIWQHKKTGRPYIGFVEGKHLNHRDLIQENRSRMKIMLFDPSEDLPVDTISALLRAAIDLYQTGAIKIK